MLRSKYNIYDILCCCEGASSSNVEGEWGAYSSCFMENGGRGSSGELKGNIHIGGNV
jgi:hypothetical protein